MRICLLQLTEIMWVLVLFFPILFALGFAVYARRKRRLDVVALKHTVEGLVVDCEVRATDFYFRTKVKYTFSARDYEASFLSPKDFTPGQKITLFLDPNNPLDFELEDQSIRIE